MADKSKSSETKHVQEETEPISNLLTIKEGSDGTEMNEKEKLKKEATMLFLQGKRAVYIKDFQAAVVALSESCQLFGQVYPEQDDSLADPFFYYGKALLEVARSETDVLGDQMQENEDADGDEDGDDDDDVDDEHDAAAANDDDASTEHHSKNIDHEVQANGTNLDEHKAVENGEMPVNGSENVDAKISDEDKNEEINDLQLSWEYLELAKLIYSKKAETCKEAAIKLAETYLCLGENGLESENYSIAVEDIKQALELQKKHLVEFDRRIAETYYQLGIAYSLGQNYDEAISNFKMAIEQLNKKVTSLETRQKMGDSKTEEEEKDAFYTMDGEVKEIKSVIKDIEEKIKDMFESKNQVKAELIKQVVSGGHQPGSSTSSNSECQASSSSSLASAPSILATDISHLIKKKRKNDDAEVSVEKKSKTEN